MHYPLVVISDLHFGINNSSADLLAEFLNHVDCDRLVLNGDIFDGEYMKAHKSAELPEMQKRALDALNAKIAAGTEVIYIPGNHDAELRDMNLTGKRIWGLTFAQEMDIMHKGERLLITHGDQLKAGAVTNHFGKIPSMLSWAHRHGYAVFSKISSFIDKVSSNLLKRHFSIAAACRKYINQRMNIIGPAHRKLMTDARQRGYRGVICGHFHSSAMKREKDGFLYLNSGDWLDNFTALTLNNKDEWEILHWADVRLTLDLKRHFNPTKQQNPNQAFRPMTEKMLTQVQKIWPGKQV